MKQTFLVDIKILERKNNGLQIVDKIKKMPVDKAIIILRKKYSTKQDILSFLDEEIILDL